MHDKMAAASPTTPKLLLYDYVPWEQMTKQRRGIMWAVQTARAHKRTLVLPPLRFHTDQKDVYEYVNFSSLFDMAPLHALHPVLELDDVLADEAHRAVDVVFSITRGMPPADVDPAGRDWVPGECKGSLDPTCEVDADGQQDCVTAMNSFGHTTGSFLVRNLTCGWIPDLRWDRVLRSRDVRDAHAVGLHGIIYQIPPPKSMKLLSSYVASRDQGGTPCEWRCPYEHLRAALQYRPPLVEAARAFVAAAQSKHRNSSSNSHPSSSSDARPARLLAVHWRRGDFLSRGGAERVCLDEGTGEDIFEIKAATEEAGTAAAGTAAAAGAAAAGGGAAAAGAAGGGLRLSGSPCSPASVVLPPEDLATEVEIWMREQGASVLFLATNANAEDVASLQAALGPGITVLRFPSSEHASEAADDVTATSSSDGRPAVTAYSRAELAVLDTLICALSDAFLGTRRSMFSWNILEERVLLGQDPTTGGLMGLVRKGKRRAVTKRAFQEAFQEAQRHAAMQKDAQREPS